MSDKVITYFDDSPSDEFSPYDPNAQPNSDLLVLDRLATIINAKLATNENENKDLAKDSQPLQSERNESLDLLSKTETDEGKSDQQNSELDIENQKQPENCILEVPNEDSSDDTSKPGNLMLNKETNKESVIGLRAHEPKLIVFLGNVDSRKLMIKSLSEPKTRIFQPGKPKNLIIQWETPCQEIKQEFTYEGIEIVDPNEYKFKYADMLTPSDKLPQFVEHFYVPFNYALAANKDFNKLPTLIGDIDKLNLVDFDLTRRLESPKMNEDQSKTQKFFFIGQETLTTSDIFSRDSNSIVEDQSQPKDEQILEGSRGQSPVNALSVLSEPIEQEQYPVINKDNVNAVLPPSSSSTSLPLVLPKLNDKADHLIDELALDFLIDKLANNLNYDQLITDIVNFYSSNPKALLNIAKRRVIIKN